MESKLLILNSKQLSPHKERKIRDEVVIKDFYMKSNDNDIRMFENMLESKEVNSS